MNQDQALGIIKKGNNCFVTGKAGTGKTFLLNLLKEKLNEKNMYFTASTGIAATHLNGTTIHSWSGIGIKSSLNPHDLEKIANNNFQRRKICNTEILIIDEISMLNAYQLDMVDKICRYVRNKNYEPFGGIQVILCGDFFQLPPIDKSNPKPKFAFESEIWNKMNLKVCYLDHVYRQSDRDFLNLLEGIRDNNVSDESLTCLKSREGAYIDSGIINPIKLFPTNREVDSINNFEYNKIEGEEHIYKMTSGCKSPAMQWMVDNLKDSCLAPEILKLKVGTSVMFLKNKYRMEVDEFNDFFCLYVEYVNGTLGTVVDFDGTGNPIVEIDGGKRIYVEHDKWEKEELNPKTGKREPVAFICQMPLKLAWAVTVHKCVSKDTLISTPKGLEYIKNFDKEVKPQLFNEHDFEVFGKEGIDKVSQVFCGGIKKCIKITTESGYNLTGSFEHPIIIRGKEGYDKYVRLSDLKIGNVTVIKKGLLSEGNNEININKSKINNYHTSQKHSFPSILCKDFAWFLGMVIGDGCITDKKDGRVDITNQNEKIIDRFVNFVEDKFKRKVTIIKKENYFCAYFHSKPVRECLYQIGLDYNKSIKKSIPKIIFNSSIENQREFIKGLFDADGGVNSSINYTSSSNKLMKEVQLLLLNLNIVSSVSRLKSVNSNRLSITGINAYYYMRDIGFMDYDKQMKGKIKYGEKNYIVPKSQKGFFPNSTKLTKKIYYELLNNYGVFYGKGLRLHLKDKKISKFLTRIIREKSTLHPEHINYLYEKLPVDFENYYNEYKNILFEKIIKIEYIDEYVYDLYVPKTHSFIGDGFINHNSQGMSLDFVEMDLSETFIEGMGYVALSRVKTLEGLRILGYNNMVLRVDPAIVDQDKIFQRQSRKVMEGV